MASTLNAVGKKSARQEKSRCGKVTLLTRGNLLSADDHNINGDDAQDADDPTLLICSSRITLVTQHRM